MRATLGVLRSEEDGDGSGLSQLDSLVARARAAGLPVTVTVTGEQRPLPPEADQAAYRIVQEALTNVSRHAGHACASVHLHYTPETLSIQVDDDGKGTVTSTGTRPSGPGLGLAGMRDIFAALRAGASGFLLKDTQPAELLQALRVVMRGDALLSPAVTRRLISEFVARPPDAVAGRSRRPATP